MLPAIQAIPTSRTSDMALPTLKLGINQMRPNIPFRQTVQMVWTSRISPIGEP
jgi:hypothetical protein